MSVAPSHPSSPNTHKTPSDFHNWPQKTLKSRERVFRGFDFDHNVLNKTVIFSDACTHVFLIFSIEGFLLSNNDRKIPPRRLPIISLQFFLRKASSHIEQEANRILSVISEFMGINTLFVAFNDENTNYIVKVSVK